MPGLHVRSVTERVVAARRPSHPRARAAGRGPMLHVCMIDRVVDLPPPSESISGISPDAYDAEMNADDLDQT